MKRTTVYLDEALHRALQLKAIESDHSVSELINNAIKFLLAEDSSDIEAYRKRKNEPSISFENGLKKLKE
ncbi:MAG: ribbon-helix-helix domain-containing protein, partial [Candidatus Omnitrophica bacterium]|nr:ribbon-helix-helix domain-containing protein [Candidatus Omnitrophota bacterium]